MRRPGPPDARVGVEMVEVTDADGAPADPAATAGPDDASPHPGRRSLRRLGIAVIAVLALAAVTVTVLETRRDAARREAFTDLGWVMPAMPGPPQEVWRAQGGAVLAQVDGTVVTQSAGPDLTVRAVETATGRVLWERTDTNEECNTVLDGSGRGPAARPADGRPPVLMCIAFDAPGSDGTPPAEAASAPFTFVDLETGAVQAQVTVSGQLLGYAEVDEDVLFFTIRFGGSVGVVRVDPWSGRVVWDWTSASGVRPRQPADWTWHLDEDRGVLRLEGARTVAVAVDDGRQLKPGPRSPDGVWTTTFPLASGQVVAATQDLSTGVARISVLEADGTTRFDIDGSPWRIGFDDGSVPDALVVQRAPAPGATRDVTLTSIDLGTGEERWSLPGASTWPLFLLEGTAVVATASTVGALDVDAGEWLWQHPVAADLPYDPLTDGDVVLVPVADGGGRALAALQVRTGEERWRMPLPADAVSVLRAQDGTLLVTTRSELIAYR